MKIDVQLSRKVLLKGVGTTVGAYGAGRVVRLAGSIALARLLTPELFGIIAIVNSVRTGIDLLSNVGVAQSIIQNKNGEEPEFYNTGWTLKAIRGTILWLFACAVTPFVAQLYNSQILYFIMPVATLHFLFDGFTSISFSILQKRMKITELNVLGFIFELVPAALMVILAYLYRSIWSMVLGFLIASAMRMVLSFFLVSDIKIRFHLSRQYMWEIMHFGKWIFLSTAIYFFSSNFDRLYLGKMVPFALLGIYGVARSLTDTITQLVGQLSGYFIFPYIAQSSDRPRDDLHRRVAPLRLRFLFLTAVGLSGLAAFADVPIKILYDPRYYAAAGIMTFTALGTWFAIISGINESVLLGFARPQYAALGSALKLGWLLVGLPIGYAQYGFFGVILVVAFSDLFRYTPILFGQVRARFSFSMQDILMTIVMFGLFGFFVLLRWLLGFGFAFDNAIV